MGVFSSVGGFVGRGIKGGILGAGAAGVGSGWDQDAMMGGAIGGAAMGGIGSIYAARARRRLGIDPAKAMGKLGTRVHRSGEAARIYGLNNITSDFMGTAKGRTRNTFSRSMIRSGNAISSVGLGLKRSAVGINKTGNAAMFALGTGAAGHIGGSVMESNGGPRRIQRRREAMYPR